MTTGVEFLGVDLIIIFFVLFGITGIGSCFIVGMPVVGNLLVGMWTTVMGEQAIAMMSGEESGTKQE